jgi:hypothetical protein
VTPTLFKFYRRLKIRKITPFERKKKWVIKEKIYFRAMGVDGFISNGLYGMATSINRFI